MTEVLVKWLHLPDCDNSWESLDALKLQYPEHHLEDKVALLEGGSVRNQRFRQVYTRRNRRDRGMGQNTSPIVNTDDRAESERLVS